MKDKDKKIFEQNAEIRLQFQEICDDDIERLCKLNTNLIQMLDIGRNKITSQGLEYFSKVNWNNLISINLEENMIGAKGCKYITRISMSCLQSLYIGLNNIQSHGVFHLSKSNWKNLRQLSLRSAAIKSMSVGWLIKGIWSQINYIFIDENNLQLGQVFGMFLSQFQGVKILNINSTEYTLCPENNKLCQMFQEKFVNAFN